MSCLCSGGPNCCAKVVTPFKCPDCGTWWSAGYEHRCPPTQGVMTIGNIRVGSTVYCTCPANRGDMYVGTCPIHDQHTTSTVTYST